MSPVAIAKRECMLCVCVWISVVVDRPICGVGMSMARGCLWCVDICGARMPEVRGSL